MFLVKKNVEASFALEDDYSCQMKSSWSLNLSQFYGFKFQFILRVTLRFDLKTNLSLIVSRIIFMWKLKNQTKLLGTDLRKYCEDEF